MHCTSNLSLDCSSLAPVSSLPPPPPPPPPPFFPLPPLRRQGEEGRRRRRRRRRQRRYGRQGRTVQAQVARAMHRCQNGQGRVDEGSGAQVAGSAVQRLPP